MTAVSLSRRLSLEAPSRVPDGMGGFAETWSELGQHWAEVTPGRGRSVATGELELSSAVVEIVVRGAPVGAISRPLPGQRFREGARLWRILSVTERDPSGRYLSCTTIEEAVA